VLVKLAHKQEVLMAENKREIKVKFHIPDNHKSHFTTSVWGGIDTRKGLLEIHFLHDRPPLPKFSIDTIDENGKLIKSMPDTSGYTVIRSVQTGVIMDIEAAKNLQKWLKDKLEVYDLQNKGDQSGGTKLQ
jgi:hypothetical protein